MTPLRDKLRNTVIQIDFVRMTAAIRGKPVHLTNQEFLTMRRFLEAPEWVLTGNFYPRRGAMSITRPHEPWICASPIFAGNWGRGISKLFTESLISLFHKIRAVCYGSAFERGHF